MCERDFFGKRLGVKDKRQKIRNLLPTIFNQKSSSLEKGHWRCHSKLPAPFKCTFLAAAFGEMGRWSDGFPLHHSSGTVDSPFVTDGGIGSSGGVRWVEGVWKSVPGALIHFSA
jgi:hypothetical protein